MKRFSVLIIFLFPVVLAAQESSTKAADESNIEVKAITNYNVNRQHFVDRKKALKQRFNEQRVSISYGPAYLKKKKQVEDKEQLLLELEQKYRGELQTFLSEKETIQQLVGWVQADIDTEQGKINYERSRVAQTERSLTVFERTRAGLLVWFFPFIGIGVLSSSFLTKGLPFASGFYNTATGILIVFFVVWLINIYTLLWKKDQPFMQRYKWQIVTAFVLLICLFSAPIFAQEEKIPSTFEEQLEQVDKILETSGHDRFITILKNKIQQNIKLPQLESNDPYLKPFRQVSVDSAEYYFTLGALYTYKNKYGEAISTIKKLLNKNIKINSTNRSTVYIASIKFLIDQQQTDAASDLLAIAKEKLKKVDALIDLAQFLDKSGMQASSDELLDQAIKIAANETELVKLARVFFANNSTDKAGSAIDRAIATASNASALMEISKAAREMNFEDKGFTALDKAIKQAQSPTRLIALYNYANKIKNKEQSIAALQKALAITKKPSDLIKVTQTALAGRHDDIIYGANKKAIDIMDNDERISLIDLYLKNNFREDAVSVFEDLIGEIKKSDTDKREKLIALANIAIDRKIYEQALHSVEKLAVLSDKEDRDNLQIKPNRKLTSIKGIPELNSLELQLYFGLLSEEMEQMDSAREHYQRSVRGTLKNILESYGYSTPEKVNNFYLLGRALEQTKDYVVLEKLDKVYTKIEDEIIKKIADDYKQSVFELQSKKDKEGFEQLDEEIGQLKRKEASILEDARYQKSNIQNDIKWLKERTSSLEEQLINKKQELLDYKTVASQEKKKNYLLTASAFGGIVFLLSIITGCILWVYHKHAKHLNRMKTFGFVSKYIETEGWVRIVSILGFISGILSVLLSQVLQIFQGVHEELITINNKNKLDREPEADKIETQKVVKNEN